MSTRRRTQQGFTLVEILIVVVILGILAAIVIPQFTSASEAARGSSAVTLLQTIRSQLELAQIQHGGVYPDLITSSPAWTEMVTATEPTTAYAAAVAPATNDVGPYLQQPPINPFEGSTIVVALGAQAAGDGWTYSSTTGEIYVVCSSTKRDELSLTENVDCQSY